MKKGQPLCAREVDTALGLEKLVSVFSIIAFGYILSSAIGVREEDGQRYSSYKKRPRDQSSFSGNLNRPSPIRTCIEQCLMARNLPNSKRHNC